MTTVLNKCISADSHVTEPAGTYIDRIDPKYRDRAPRMHYDESFGDVMLIDGGKSLVPFWMVAAAGRPTEAGAARHPASTSKTCGAAAGIPSPVSPTRTSTA